MKLKANASKHKAMSYDRTREKEKAAASRSENNCLARAEAAYAEEDARYGKNRKGDELPAELETGARPVFRRSAKPKRHWNKERAQKKQRPKASDPKQAQPKDKDQYNFTDPESRIMKGADGFVQAYNAQAAVEADLQLIVGCAITAGDQRQVATVADDYGDRNNRVGQ